MPSPFPGMDPYLEQPALWPGFHSSLIVEIRNALNAHIRPRYIASIEQRVYIANEHDDLAYARIPDVTIEYAARGRGFAAQSAAAVIEAPFEVKLPRRRRELRLEILPKGSRQPVTVIEVLSPSNKVPHSAGRRSFLKKKREILDSTASWVEIDLLRGGARTAGIPENVEYSVACYPAKRKHRLRFWQFGLQRPMPTVGIPLAGDDPDVPLELQKVFTTAYDLGGYDVLTDYRAKLFPALPRALASWSKKILKGIT